MKAKELIEALSKLDPETRIYTDFDGQIDAVIGFRLKEMYPYKAEFGGAAKGGWGDSSDERVEDDEIDILVLE